MSVNGIRKQCTDEEVVALSKILIKNWKRLLGKALQSNYRQKRYFLVPALFLFGINT